MQIQNVNSYNQRSNVNFRAKLINNPADFACLLPDARSASDVHHTIAKVLKSKTELPGTVQYQIAGDIMGSGYGLGEAKYCENGAVTTTRRLRIPVREGQKGVVQALEQLFAEISDKVTANKK